MTTKIILKVEERETKTEPKKKFPVYATTTKGGNIVKVKFQRDVKHLPEETGTYEAYFDSEKANLTKDFYGLVMWIADNGIKWRPIQRVDKVKDEFETVANDEELPF